MKTSDYPIVWTQYFAALVAVSLLFFFVRCDDSPAGTEEIVDIEIIRPKINEPYNALNQMQLIGRYNPKVVALPGWMYSKNDGKDWEIMTVTRDSSLVASKDDPYEWSTRRWTPISDSITNDTILVKLTSYGTDPIFVKIGPVIIE